MTRKTEKEDGVKLASRFEHMALIVKLDEKWFLCDCGWGGICFTGAVDMDNTTETSNLKVRCTPTPEKALRQVLDLIVDIILYGISQNFKPYRSTLRQGASKYWYLGEFFNFATKKRAPEASSD